MSRLAASRGSTGVSPLLSAAQMKKLIQEVVRAALAEDIGSGDISSAIFPRRESGSAQFLAKQPGILSGTAIVSEVFRQLSPTVRLQWKLKDGQPFRKGQVIGNVSGPYAVLLQGERVSLNFLQRMSGVATATRHFVDALGKQPNLGIYDTRKTTPLLRAFEKQAVQHGGGRSHRYALYDMAMLKNNHIDAAGGVVGAVQRLQENGFFALRPKRLLCIEARDEHEALEATANRADIVLLDNMPPADIRATVLEMRKLTKRLGRGMPQVEVSGGINLQTIKSYARLPIDRISVGSITHSAPALDIALHFNKS